MPKLDAKNKVTKDVRKNDRIQTERRLILAAEKIYSRVGYEGATTRMIAEEAGINLSLINRYFDGKYGLMVAVVRQRQDVFKQQELTYPPQADLRSELTEYGRFVIERYLRELHLIRICVSQFLSDAKFLKKFREIIVDKSFNIHLEERLKTHLQGRGSDFIKQVRSSVEDTETFGFGLILTARIMLNLDEKEILRTMEDYCQTHFLFTK